MKTRLLQCLIFLRRQPPVALVATVIWLATTIIGTQWFLLHQEIQSQAKHLSALQAKAAQMAQTSGALTAATVPSISVAEQFQAMLGIPDELQEDLKILFRIAGKQDLRLIQGSYKTTLNTAGAYESYSIELPVTGSYQKIRKLSEDILLALPFSALEEIKFKRENASNAQLEAELKLVLFLRVTENPEPSAATRIERDSALNPS